MLRHNLAICASLIMFGVGGAAADDGTLFSGPYVGGGIGMTSQSFDASRDSSTVSLGCTNCGPQGNSSDAGDVSEQSVGASGHVLAGYLFAEDALRFGLETDFTLQALGYQSQDDCSTPACARVMSAADLNQIFRARAIVGHASDNLFLFVTGGLAFGNAHAGYKAFALSSSGSDEDYAGFDGWTAGWTVGAGGQLALREGLSLRGEVLYDDFGKKDGGSASAESRSPANGARASIDWSGETRLNQVSARLSLIFEF